MTDREKMIWAVAYVREYEEYTLRGTSNYEGFFERAVRNSIAVADEVVSMYRLVNKPSEK